MPANSSPPCRKSGATCRPSQRAIGKRRSPPVPTTSPCRNSWPAFANALREKPSEGADMPKKILVVDDERHIVRLVQVNLERHGFIVVTAFNGKEALEQVE